MIRPRQSCLLLWIALVVGSPTAFAQDGSFTRDGVQLFYRTSGSGAPIIFLSGGPGFTVDYMVPVGEFVPASYQRVFYEQRGTGRSKVATMTAENMTLRHVVADLEALPFISSRSGCFSSATRGAACWQWRTPPRIRTVSTG
jgi:proline iminopeptidase